jgi:ribosomal protein S18 acetylase RimI-like enzyme
MEPIRLLSFSPIPFITCIGGFMYKLQPLSENDRPALRRFWMEHWGDEVMALRGRVYTVDELAGGFIALEDGQWIGLVTFMVEGVVCEVMTLDSLREGQGIGTALVAEVEKEARRLGCTCLRLVTTNDNMNALRFYQKRGFVLTALRPAALDVSRRLKPSIPLIGCDGIPLRDELELEKRLDDAA